MPKREWTEPMNLNLVEAVQRAIASGFHRNQGPKRADDLGRYWFWDTVAIMMADGPDSPTPDTCRSRYKEALEYAITVTAMNDAIKRDLAKWDELWPTIEAADAMAHDAHDQIEKDLEFLKAESMATMERIAYVEDRLNALCKAWDVK